MTVVIISTVVEGLALLDLGVSPYSGDVFHEVKTTVNPVYAALDLSRPHGRLLYQKLVQAVKRPHK